MQFLLCAGVEVSLHSKSEDQCIYSSYFDSAKAVEHFLKMYQILKVNFNVIKSLKIGQDISEQHGFCRMNSGILEKLLAS